MRRKLAIGATGLVVLGGGGAAYAVTKANDNPRQAFLGDVAKRLNVTPQQLDNALKGAFDDRLQAAVKAGRLTQAQADAIKKKVAQGGGPPMFGPGIATAGPGPGFMFGRRVMGPVMDGLDGAAKYLGLTNQQLVQKLRSGKSLADVAGEQNKSVDGLKSAITASVKSDLDQAVKAGKLTQTQESKILNGLATRLDTLVNRKGMGPIGVGPGPGFFFHAAGPLKGGIDAAAKYLGLSDRQLMNKVMSGKSLADIAGEQKKSVDGLKTAIQNAVKTDIDNAVKNGDLTQTQANKLLSRLGNRLDTLVNRKGLLPRPRFVKPGALGAKRQFRFGAAPAPPSPPSGVPII
ncbi:MAG TPA: hypothetical protein VF032_19160 [Thermoleophilaceae bacterium]